MSSAIVTEAELLAAGVTWPKRGELADRTARVDGGIDLDATRRTLASARAHYDEQVRQAQAFKQQWRVPDISDVSDRYEDHVHLARVLAEAIAFVDEAGRKLAAKRAREQGRPPKREAPPAPLAPPVPEALAALVARSHEELLAADGRTPTRDEIAAMLAAHFQEGADADRLHGELVALLSDEVARVAASRAFRAEGPAHAGESWWASVTRRAWPRPIDLAAWIAVTRPGHPSPRPHCPWSVVGRWEDGEGGQWSFDRDGAFRCTDGELSRFSRWRLVPSTTKRRLESGDGIVLEGDGGATVTLALNVDDLFPSTLLSLSFSRSRVVVLRVNAAPKTALPLVERGRARTIAEARFAISLTRPKCARCGTYETGEPANYAFQDATWFFRCTCRRCKTELHREVPAVDDAADDAVPGYDELGPGASQLVPAETFRAELARLSALVAERPEELVPSAWYASAEALQRAILCANELSKLEPSDATRTARERLLAIRAAYVADKERPPSMERGPRVPPVGEVTRETMQAHAAFVARGGVGEGRLVAERGFVSRSPEHRADLRGMRLVAYDLASADFAHAKMDGAELVDVTTGRGARLFELREALILGGTFVDAEIGTLERARVIGADLSGVTSGASWKEAELEGVCLRGARLERVCLDGASFVGCDFRGTYFGTSLHGIRSGTMRGARFVDCDLDETRWDGRDLSGATFVRCRAVRAAATST